MPAASLVAVRARIMSVEGLAAAGRFDAAWAIGMNAVYPSTTGKPANGLLSVTWNELSSSFFRPDISLAFGGLPCRSS